MNKNFIETFIDGRLYTVNLEEAVKLGLIKEKKTKRKLSIKDIPNGSVFTDNIEAQNRRFVMLDNTKKNDEQLVFINERDLGLRSGFDLFYDSLIFSYWDIKNKMWISEIEEG